MISYSGIFFLDEEKQKLQNIEKTFLGTLNDELHCTFKYKPSEEEIKKFNNIVGQKIECYIYAYGCNGKHSRFLIKFPSEYKKYYFNNVEPHITASFLKTEKAFEVDSKTMKYEEIPILKVSGIFGYWIKEEVKNEEYVNFKRTD